MAKEKAIVEQTRDSTIALDEDEAKSKSILLNSLSSSYPGSSLSKALLCAKLGESDDVESDDPLSKSCFSELRLVKEPADSDSEDDLDLPHDIVPLTSNLQSEKAINHAACGQESANNVEIKNSQKEPVMVASNSAFKQLKNAKVLTTRVNNYQAPSSAVGTTAGNTASTYKVIVNKDGVPWKVRTQQVLYRKVPFKQGNVPVLKATVIKQKETSVSDLQPIKAPKLPILQFDELSPVKDLPALGETANEVKDPLADVPQDDDLTSLSWLHSSDLLKDLPMSTSVDDNNAVMGPYPGGSVTYDPQTHVKSKPPYSFSCLIFMAIEASEEKQVPVRDIYGWILHHFPYYQNAPTGWKNSVRHNLSLNKCFKKVHKGGINSAEPIMHVGKGSLWCIDPDFRPNLLQALRKTPYHPYHQLQIMSSITSNSSPNKADAFKRPSPHLFPFLNKRLQDISMNSDIDVANALVSLKSSSKRTVPKEENFSDDEGHGSRSPSPPEFGSERDKRRKGRRNCKKKNKAVNPRDHSYSAHDNNSGDISPVDEAYVEWNEDVQQMIRKGKVAERKKKAKIRKAASVTKKVLAKEVMTKRRGKTRTVVGEKTLSSPKKRRQMKIKMPDLPRKRRKVGDWQKKSNNVNSAKKSAIKSPEDEEGAATALLDLAGVKAIQSVPLRSISPVATSQNLSHGKGKSTSLSGQGVVKAIKTEDLADVVDGECIKGSVKLEEPTRRSRREKFESVKLRDSEVSKITARIMRNHEDRNNNQQEGLPSKRKSYEHSHRKIPSTHN